MSTDRLVAAQTGWNNANTITRINNTFTGKNFANQADIHWRPDKVTDYRGKRVLSAAVRLIRWDDENPDKVFSAGFAPLQTNAATSVFDLYAFKVNKKNSVFVSATNCFADRDQGVTTRWVPNDYETIGRNAILYEYEIFAHGGIDVDRSLVDVSADLRKGDVAFPGGIRCDFVRSAIEYDPTGKPVRYWLNGNFDLEANGAPYIPKTDELPPHVYPPGIPVAMWTKGNVTNRPKPPPTTGLSDDIMAIFNGVQKPVHIKDEINRPIGRAAFLLPFATDEAYIASDTRAVRFKVMADQVVKSVKNIDHTFTTLDQAGFTTVDACLPSGNGNNAWFFCGTQYVSLDVVTAKLAYLPSRNIMEKWNCLRQAGFATVNAVIPVPKKSEAYFFRGTQYVHVDFTKDIILEGPADVRKRWPVLGEAGFTTIDCALLKPTDFDEVYFMSGSEYVLVSMDGKSLLVGAKRIRGNWKVLTDCNFY